MNSLPPVAILDNLATHSSQEKEMTVRRVVTGHDAKGRAVVVSDERIDPILHPFNPDYSVNWLWGNDGSPEFPDSGLEPEKTTYHPPLGGFRFGLFTLPGRDSVPPADLDIPKAIQELERLLPGAAQYMEPDDPGMHTTPSIDFEIVLSGEVVLEVDDRKEVVLQPGDTVVQNGTRHRWHNRGTVPATVAVFSVGAHHQKFNAD